MKESVKEWLTKLLDEHIVQLRNVGEVISDYFGEDLVDVQVNIEEIIDNAIGDTTVGLLINSLDSDFPDVSDRKWSVDRNVRIKECDEVYFQALTPKMDRILSRYCDNNIFNIIIRFPHVTVTNEYDRSVDITELYTKLRVKGNGILRNPIEMMRAEYTAEQYLSGYAHSHLPGSYLEWMRPCLGTGPINRTIGTISSSCDLDYWGLFCYELSKYVTVESIAGAPYVRMESIGSSRGGIIEAFPVRLDSTPLIYGNGNNPVPVFIKYYTRTQEFPLAFVDGVYVLGKDPLDFLVEISQCFIRWYNRQYSLHAQSLELSQLVRSNILKRYIINNRKLYMNNGSSRLEDLSTEQGRDLFMFKGQMVTLNFTENNINTDANTVTLLSANIVSCIITRFLRVINYARRNKGTAKASGTEETNTIDKKCQLI